MKIQLGPILIFVSADATTWRCRAVYVFREVAGALQLQHDEVGGTRTVNGARILAHGEDEVWAYELGFARDDQDRARSYNLIGESPNSLIVPGQGRTPHLAFASCCGFHDWKDKLKLDDRKKDPWAVWTELKSQHDASPFHLMLLGGDQVYVDGIWEKGALREWRDKLRVFQGRHKWEPDGPYDRQTRGALMEIYQNNWGRKEMRAALASIPSIMMWDDHDICDGWGSHPDDVQAFPVMQGLFGVAREYFQAFQLGRAATSPRPPQSIGPDKQFSSLHFFGDIAILSLDLRSRRRRNRVMLDAKGWDELFTDVSKRWSTVPGDKPKHLLVMSSVPVVYVSGPSDLTSIFLWDPVTDPQDDLIDQWSDYRHTHEREIFVRGLLKFGRETGTRVTILSGDIHVATLAIIESKRDEDAGSNSRVINQLTSSGIVNLPPNGMALFAIDLMLKSPQQICRDVIGETVPLATGWPKVIAARNWLSLRPAESPAGSLLAEWHVEGRKSCPPKTITPV